MLPGRARNIVIIATVFNVLFEYSMRGINELIARPFFILVLIAAYASIFTMQEDLIRRFRLRDYHLVVLAFTYGMIFQGLVSGTAFIRPEFAGIRWSHSLFVLLAWWGGVQSVLTYYLATRLCPRDWSRPLLSRRDWLAAAAANLAVIALFQWSGRIPRGTPAGYVTMLVVTLAAVALFARLSSRGQDARAAAPAPMPNLALDIIALGSVLVFLVCALALTSAPTVIGTSAVNATATRVVVRWTLAACLVLLGYRAVTRRPIPI